MLVQINGQTLSIIWRHHYISKKRIFVGNDGKKDLYFTQTKPVSKKWSKCIIRIGVGEGVQVIAEAKAYCSKEDTFCKCEGRKVSLTKALMYLNPNPEHNPNTTFPLSEEQRKQIWEQYVLETKCNFEITEKHKKHKLSLNGGPMIPVTQI